MERRQDTPITDPLPDALPPGIHRLHSREETTHVLAHLDRAGWCARYVDLAGALDKPGILAAFQTGLELPSWFGHSWDALADSLRDLGWLAPGPRGRAIVIRGAGRLDTGTEHDRAQVEDILDEAVDSFAATDTPLVVLLRR
ncbi:MAG: barstar family protein [Chloroflexota bacterium]